MSNFINIATTVFAWNSDKHPSIHPSIHFINRIDIQLFYVIFMNRYHLHEINPLHSPLFFVCLMEKAKKRRHTKKSMRYTQSCKMWQSASQECPPGSSWRSKTSGALPPPSTNRPRLLEHLRLGKCKVHEILTSYREKVK